MVTHVLSPNAVGSFLSYCSQKENSSVKKEVFLYETGVFG